MKNLTGHEVEKIRKEGYDSGVAETVERCSELVEKVTTGGGYETNLIRRIRSLSPDPNWLAEHEWKIRQEMNDSLAEIERRNDEWLIEHDGLVRLEARLAEAKRWRYVVIMDEDSYFAVEGDKHIADLQRQLDALVKPKEAESE